MSRLCVVEAVYVGSVGALPLESRPTAIVKRAVAGRVALGPLGLAGDEHGDPRVHGGPDKALHLFPAEHHARLAAAFPAARHLAPGGLGANVSTHGLDEADVCLGDRYAISTAVVEVSQPRSPCWKIDARTGVEGVAAYVAMHGCTGWYFRVVQAGKIGAGDAIARVARPDGAVTLADYWRVVQMPRPPLAELARVAAAPGLSADTRTQWLDRLARLAALGDQP